MSTTRLLFKNLLYHWRGNLAILLGVVVGAAVLTGALLVGDSLRGSLRDLTLQRLGWVDQVVITPRFFREEVATAKDVQDGATKVEPVLMLRATANATSTEQQARQVNLIGVRSSIWKIEADDGFVLNETLASALQVREGDEVTFTMRRPGEMPSESLLGREKTGENVRDLTVKVERILAPGESIADLKLTPDPTPARNAFVPLAAIQKLLKVEGKINGVLIQGAKADFRSKFRSELKLEDWGLVLRDPENRASQMMGVDRRGRPVNRLTYVSGKEKIPLSWAEQIEPTWVVKDNEKNPTAPKPISKKQLRDFIAKNYPYFSLESRTGMLQKHVVDAAIRVAEQEKIRYAPTLVYLVDSIYLNKKSPKTDIPYSVVAAVDPTLKPPLGPFLPKGKDKLLDDQIVLAAWKSAPPLPAAPTKVEIEYYEPEHQGQAKKKSETLKVAGYVPLEGLANDANLTPEFPGITDQPDMGRFRERLDWYKPERVKGSDDDYWHEHRTTPKAYVTLATGKKLWKSRFGELTSIRFALKDDDSRTLETAEEKFRDALETDLRARKEDFAIRNVREESLKASKGGGFDFGMLFVSFSFFLIVAALLLIGLLFRLSLDRRASQLGLLYATGFTQNKVRRLLLLEGTIITMLGAVIGLGIAIVYAEWLLDYLRDNWPGQKTLFFLKLHRTPMSLGMGYGLTLLMSVGTIWWSLRSLAKLSPRTLLQGQTSDEKTIGSAPKTTKWRVRVGIGSVILALLVLPIGFFVDNHEAQAGSFFSGGMLLLIGGLSLFSAWMGSSKQIAVHGQGTWAITKLGIRNAARHSSRSMLTAGLLASAAFLLVAVECFRRSVGDDFLAKDSGSGGYPLMVESDLPIVTDIGTEKGRKELIDRLGATETFQKMSAEKRDQRLKEIDELLAKSDIRSLRVREGDDASCLNLFQPNQPKVVGVPDSLIDGGGFKFAASMEDRENKWTLLRKANPQDPVPVIGEKNSVQWMLKSGVGGEIDITDGQGDPQKARIVATLFDSIFQSSLLVSEAQFKELYPDHVGYNLLLVKPPAGKEEAVTRALKVVLRKQGIEVVKSKERVAQFLAVENTYLSTFQLLGGFGLLLGTLGLAVVLLRSVWERRGELALLRALGYRRGVLGWLVLSENGFLLLLGLVLGTVTALISVAPHVLSSGTEVKWGNLFLTLGIVLAVGIVTALLAVASVVRAKLIPALRKE